jgi:putative zinc finger/helix-turn-helix YgiT family protein
MTCENCKGEIQERTATLSKPYRYKLSGLDHVLLIGIRVRSCEHCGLELPTIPRVGELHRLIAQMLTEKAAPLRGNEVRFLRKQAGFSAREFATLLGQSPEHLSRVENGRKRLGAAADRLVRAFASIGREEEGTRKMLLDLSARLEHAAHQRPTLGGAKSPTFRLGKSGRWKQAA